MNEYDVIIVGSGFSGSIIANRFATVLHKRVLVLEKRGHFGGNMYDFTGQYGIRIQQYGPHTFHTNNPEVHRFITGFCTLTDYLLKCETIVDGMALPMPFNFLTIDRIYEEEKAKRLKGKLLSSFPLGQATVLELLNHLDGEIRAFADFLVEKDYRPYTAKQWGLRPEEIDPSVIGRVPVVFNYQDTYFYDRFQGVPGDGYTALFRRMLDHPLITLRLETDALDHIDFTENTARFDGEELPIVYTGAIDELFACRFGRLPYRSLRFDYRYYDQKSWQNVAIVAHPLDMDCTRITEYTKLPFQDVGEKTVVAVEYALPYDKHAKVGNEPYYPVLTRDSQEMYALYKDYAKRYQNLILCGRLADFKYYNMDAVIARALDVFQDILKQECDTP